MKRNRLKIDDKSPLVPLSQRVPIFTVEHSKIVRDDNEVKIYNDSMSGAFTVPVASIGALILGPGCSITTEAARIAVSRGCTILVSGGGGVPVYLTSTQHRSPHRKLTQFSVILDEHKRKTACDVLFNARRKFIQSNPDLGIPEFPRSSNYSSINSMLAAEGAWAKKTYKKLSADMGVEWDGKLNADQSEGHPLKFLNHLSYSIADIAILHLGFDPNVGLLHGRTRGGGLTYDIADIFKPVLSLHASFLALKYEKPLGAIKADFISDVYTYDIIDLCIKVLTEAFRVEV